jgi:pyranose oxidase
MFYNNENLSSRSACYPRCGDLSGMSMRHRARFWVHRARFWVHRARFWAHRARFWVFAIALPPPIRGKKIKKPSRTIIFNHESSRMIIFLLPRSPSASTSEFFPFCTLDRECSHLKLQTNLSTFTTFEVDAKTFIVAGGPFLTPRLLWESGITPPAFGHYLNDNLETSCHVIVDPDILHEMKSMPSNPHGAKTIPIAHNDPGPAPGTTPNPEKPWHGQMHRLGRQFLYLSGVDVREQVHLTWYGIVDISYENCITFGKQKDRFGLPQIIIDFRYSRNDWIRAVRMWWDMVRTANAIGRIPGLPMLSPPGSTLHLQGTCRMGDDATQDDSTSVTNSFSRVWGFDNLYLGGLGIIPNSMASNPTLTACALAVRSAAQISGHSLGKFAGSFQRSSGQPLSGLVAESA